MYIQVMMHVCVEGSSDSHCSYRFARPLCSTTIARSPHSPPLPYIFLSFLSAILVLSISDPSLLKLQLLTHQPAASSHTSTPDPHVPAMVSLRHNK